MVLISIFLNSKPFTHLETRRCPVLRLVTHKRLASYKAYLVVLWWPGLLFATHQRYPIHIRSPLLHLDELRKRFGAVSSENVRDYL